MKVAVFGGFLGAGKTSAIRSIAALLESRGERIAIITNDQGYSLVDTALCEQVSDQVLEIGGGCFCCRYDLLEDALDAAARGGATIALAEAVGSCTDLVATVLAPLADRRGDIEVAGLSVLVDPWRAADIAAGAFPDEIAYLFRKQIEEADIVVLTRADLAPPDAAPFVRSIRSDVQIARVSCIASTGIAEWIDALPEGVAAPLSIDYDTYAAAEEMLGWANGRALIIGDEPFDPRQVITRFFDELVDAPVAHLKIRAGRGGGHLVRKGAPPSLDLDDLPPATRSLEVLVNARIAVEPSALERLLKDAMLRAAGEVTVTWRDFECFKPGRPIPIHRYPTRDSLTLKIAAELELREGSQILDIRCRDGSALRAVLGAYPVSAVGLDPEAAPGPVADGFTLMAGRPHRIAMPNACFDAVLSQQAISELLAPKPAVAEIFRVLKPGGRIGLSDSPEAMPECRRLLEEAGFAVVDTGSGFLIGVKEAA